MPRFPDPVIDLFDAQHGCAGRFQLVRHASPEEVDGWRRHGHTTNVERGVVRPTGGAQPPEQRLMAAILRARPRACVTGPAVLGLLGVDGFRADDPFEVLVSPGRTLRNVSFRWRVDPWPAGPRASVGPIVIPRPDRVVIDAARWLDELGERRVRLAYDAARWKRLTTTAKLKRTLARLGEDDPGVRSLLRATGGELDTDSGKESVLAMALEARGLLVERQVWVDPSMRADLLLRAARIILEYLGSVDHATAAARLRDDERFRHQRRLGYEVIPIVDEDLRDPDATAAWIEMIVRRRLAELGA